VPHKLEIVVVQKTQNIISRAAVQVIGTQNVVSLVQQAPAKMRAKETGPAGDQYALSDQPVSQVVFHSSKFLSPNYG
jgi:hypothetical protein